MMLKTLTTLLLAAVALVLAAAAVVYFGVVNVGADVPHSGPIQALLETARQRSVAVRAEAIEDPLRRWQLRSHVRRLPSRTGCRTDRAERKSQPGAAESD